MYTRIIVFIVKSIWLDHNGYRRHMFAQSWEVHIVMQQVCKKMVINIAVCVVIHTPWLHGHYRD